MELPEEPQPNVVPLTFHFDVQKNLTDFGAAVEILVVRVNNGLLAQLPEPERNLPGIGLGIHLSGDAEPSREDVERDFRRWILSCAFRDALEAFIVFTDEIYGAASAASLFERDTSGEALFGRDYHNYEEACRKFHQAGLVKRFPLLAKVGLGFTPDVQARFESINAARNCLSHRRGIVTALDAPRGVLTVKWIRMRLVITNSTGEVRELHLGDVLDPGAGERLGKQNVAEERSFSLGERIEFSPFEFSGIGWTLLVGGKDLADATQAKIINAQARGADLSPR